MPDIRVDSAHIPPREGVGEVEPLLVLLQAVAGRDAVRSAQQSVRQSEELSEMVRPGLQLEHPDANLGFPLHDRSLTEQDDVRQLWKTTLRMTYGDGPSSSFGGLATKSSGASGHQEPWSEGTPEPSERRESWTNYDSTATRDPWFQIRQELNSRRDQLEKFHAETERLYQSSLEMRLVSEQLWTQVVSSISTSEAVSRLSGLRQELSATFQAAEHRLSVKREEIEQAARQLELRQEALKESQLAFAGWMRESRGQLNQQMEQLAYRERQLLGSLRDSADIPCESE